MLTIQATTRDSKDNIAQLRTAGKIPAVFYGAGTPSTNITVDKKDFEKVWKEAGESSTVVLNVGTKKVDALIHEVQFDAVKGTAIHADFLVVDMNKPIQVAIPLEFVGVAPAVKSGVGTLIKVMHEIEVSALPSDLPHNISVDLAKLESLDSNITVGDLVLPKGVTATTKAQEIVAAIAEQKEESEEPTAPIDLSAIEVEKKGKKDAEEAPAAE
jgi:large subunit ribosomal protein L25